MSRGPGRWQRAILDELQRREVFYVRELLSEDPSRSDRLAVIRAAHRLASYGLIAISAGRRTWSPLVRLRGGRLESLGAVIVARPGVRIDRTELKLAYVERATAAWRQWWDTHGVSDSNADVAITYEDATTASQVARAAVRVARARVEQAEAEAERLAVEGARAREAFERKCAEAEAQLAERWQVEAETLGQVLRALHRTPEAAWPERPTAKRGALASLLKLLAREGEVTEAQLHEQAQARLGWPVALVDSVLVELQVSGDYQRIVDEARCLGRPEEGDSLC
jgi:hypothetical protein